MNKTRYLMSYGHFCSDFVQGVLTAMLPHLIKQYGFSYAKASSLVMLSNLVGSIIQPLFGYMSDKMNKPWLMTVGVLSAGVGMSAIGLISGYGGICCAVIVSGIGIAMFHPQGAQVINRISDESNAGTNMGLFSFGGNLGFTLGPVTASLVIGLLGLRGTAVFVLPALLFSIFMPFVFGKHDVCKPSQAGTAKTARVDGKNRWSEFIKVCAVVITRSVVFAGIGTFLILILAEKFGMSEATGSVLLSGYYGIQAVSSLVGGKISDNLGFRKTLILSTLILALSTTGFAMAENEVIAVMIMIPLGIGSSLGYSSMVSLGQQFLPRYVGFASGITLGLSVSTGGIVAPFLGKAGDVYGLSRVYYILACVAFAALLFSYIISDEKQEGTKFKTA